MGRGYDNPKSVTLNIKQGSQGQTACGSGVIKVKKIYLLGLILTVKGTFINKAFVHCKYTFPYHLISWFSSYTGKTIWLCALHCKEIRDPYHLITLFTTTSNTHTVIKCRLQVPISHFRVREDLEKRVQVVWRKKERKLIWRKTIEIESLPQTLINSFIFATWCSRWFNGCQYSRKLWLSITILPIKHNLLAFFLKYFFVFCWHMHFE